LAVADQCLRRCRLQGRRAIAAEIFDAIYANLATAADLQEIKPELLPRLSGIERRMILRVGGVMVGLTGLTVAATGYLPRG
jgi:hypothetical protein